MPASSSVYSATLRADRRARAFVGASGLVSACTGLAVLAMLPLSAIAQGLGAIAWSVLAGAELLRTHRAWAGCVTITLAPDGSVEIARPDGRGQSGRLASGCLVFERGAWLRLASPGAPAWSELLRREVQDREQWRRFQVIYRHLPAC